jgi:YidC/Oxa1 family membrane protein insertase
MDNQNKNLLLATVLSFVVILTWFILGPIVAPDWFPEERPLTAQQAADPAAVPGAPPVAGGAVNLPSPAEQRAEALANAPRIAIETPRLSGSISLAGGRIDDLNLTGYRTLRDPDAPDVTLLSPVGTPGAQYAIYGWAPGGALPADAVPGANTEWTLESGETLTPETPVTLRWDNGAGLIFRRTMAIDADYLFTITQTVENTGTDAVRLAPWGIVARHGLPQQMNFFILHEGVVAMADGTLTEIDYDDMEDLDPVEREGGRAELIDVTANGWIGFTDHYWMTALVPASGSAFTAVAKQVPQADIYQTEARLPVIDVAPGATASSEMHLFAGAKEWETLRGYENNPGPVARLFGAEVDPTRPQIDRFVDSIDWGWFFFLTKPIFAVLHWLNAVIGNMGLAIIGLTILLKLLLFPLARKSYISMAKMKELQPEMEKIKERVGDDRMKMQKEMMELYKKEKVNPAAGCLPILLQIPIFFSLYKVIFVTIELRHAPFFGWLQDLSAPDPSSLYNLFGLLPWAAPEPGSILALIFIGVLPILLGVSMWFQQKLNPAPTDPTQAAIFAWMPWIFMFMLGTFASGLVVYWIANNVITFAQQYIIMRRHGHKPDLFGNIRSSFRRKPAVAVANAGDTPQPGKPANQPRKPAPKKGR